MIIVVIIIIVLILAVGGYYWWNREDPSALTPSVRYTWMVHPGNFISATSTKPWGYSGGFPYSEAKSKCGSSNLATRAELKMVFDKGLNMWVYGWIDKDDEVNAVYSRQEDLTRDRIKYRPAQLWEGKLPEDRMIGAWCSGDKVPVGVNPLHAMQIK